jgi:5,10-methylenetetrahydromethanopterin reductase
MSSSNSNFNSSPKIGACFQRNFPAPFVLEVAESLEKHRVSDIWIIEDCFFTSGVSLAASALARTEHLTVGLGILPSVARNPAITAMEIATLAELAPGRLIAGIGHGVQDWMQQMGARSATPVKHA